MNSNGMNQNALFRHEQTGWYRTAGGGIILLLSLLAGINQSYGQALPAETQSDIQTESVPLLDSSTVTLLPSDSLHQIAPNDRVDLGEKMRVTVATEEERPTRTEEDLSGGRDGRESITGEEGAGGSEETLPVDSVSNRNSYLTVPVGKGSVKVVAGPEYDRGGLHRVFYGGLWRDLWGTEITVPYLDLEKTAGGLTPTELGGGRQTTSLRFMGANGHEYKFRSVNKEFSSVLPNALQETFVDNILQDMISAQNPVGALVAAPLEDAAGILHATPYLFVMPDDPRLGKFREQFAGMLGMLEEHPNELEGDRPGFMGFTKIIGDVEIYDKLLEDNDNQVDYVDYLKVRLVDMLIGDWSRHKDQYRWAEYEVGRTHYWRPIPRDRDMAFTRYNGIIPWLASETVPDIEATGEDFPDIENLMWAGRVLDRRFLVPITKQTWDSVTQAFVSRLDNQRIEMAVKRMPKEYYDREGEKLTKILMSRRDQLPEASEELFKLMHEQADLWGSEQDEYVEVTRVDDEHVRVQFYKRDKETGEKKGAAYLDHTFDREWTDEIRINLLDGDDKVVVKGNVNSSITVKVDGGRGADEFVDDSKVNGYFWFTPIPDAETSTYFYDSGDNSKFGLGPGTRLDRHDHKAWREDSVAITPYFRDFGNDWSILPWFGYGSDEGITLGIKPTLTGFGYRMEPYAWKQSLGIGYAFGTQSIKAEYNGDFRTFIPNARAIFNATYSELELLNFFGFGNETTFNLDEDAAGRYDIGQRQISALYDLQIPQVSDFRFYVGVKGSYTKTLLDQSPLLDQLQPYGVEPMLLANGRTGFILDTRDNEKVPTKGFFVTIDGEYFPKILDNEEQFAKGRIEARTYLSAKLLRPVTLALRAMGEKIAGDRFPYFEAAYLGGSHSLRGFDSQRFAGDQTVAGSAELRLSLFDFKLFTRSSFGLIGYVDAGRAYLDGAPSDEWHHAFGAGISLAFIRSTYLVSATQAFSDEGNTSLYLKIGHAF